MKMKTIRRLVLLLLGIFSLLMALMILTGSSGFGYAAMAVMAVYGIFILMFWCCPSCREHIGPLWEKTCPYCGRSLLE